MNGHARGSNDVGEDEDDDDAIEESRRVTVTRAPPPAPPLRNKTHEEEESRNTIDVHRLQKNIDNWTIQVREKVLFET